MLAAVLAPARPRSAVAEAGTERRPTLPPRHDGSVTSQAPTAVAPARACAHRVLRRVFEDGAYAEKALPGRGGRARRPRPRAGDAARLRSDPARRHHRPPDRGARRTPELRASTRRSWPPCGSASTSCSTCGGSPDYAVVADAVELAKAPRAARPRPRQRGAAPGRPRRPRASCSARSATTTRRHAAVAHSHPEWIARAVVGGARRETRRAR